MQRESLTGGLAALIGDIIVGIEHRFQPFMHTAHCTLHTAHRAIHIPVQGHLALDRCSADLGRGRELW